MSGSRSGNTSEMERLILKAAAHGPFILDGPKCRCWRIRVSCHRHVRMRQLPLDVLRRHMRLTKTSVLALLMALLIGLIGGVCLAGCQARAEDAKPALAIQFVFDRPLEASMAPFVVAANRGLFAKEGINVSTISANGPI